MELKSYHIFVSGRVQGVGFRFRTKIKANQLGLTGWVKNLADGRVEILAEGEKEKLEELKNWIKSQPIFSKVDGLEIEELPCEGSFDKFEVIV